MEKRPPTIQRNMCRIIKEQIQVFCLVSFGFDRLLVLTEGLSEPKRLHSVQLLCRHHLNVFHSAVASRRHSAMLVKRFEYLPPPSPIPRISSRAVGQEERLDGFRPEASSVCRAEETEGRGSQKLPQDVSSVDECASPDDISVVTATDIKQCQTHWLGFIYQSSYLAFSSCAK
jgi:hypothetical protein